MGFFSRLLGRAGTAGRSIETDDPGRLKKSTLGTPLKYACAKCGAALHAGSGEFFVGGPNFAGPLSEHLHKKGMLCKKCDKLFCPDCCLKAGVAKMKATGAQSGGFACPSCGDSHISNEY